MTRMQRWTLVAAVLASATVFLDSTVVNVALPRIGRELPHPLLGVLEGQTYVYTGYLLSLSTLLILAGALTDAYGRRRVFLLGLVGFGTTSALCGLAPNLETLVVLRVLQGIAGAFLVPGSLALITASFSGPLQGRAFGIWSGASSGTTLLGPAVGGLLVDTLSWRAAFFINIPITAIAIYATWRHVPETRAEHPPSGFDWLGAIIVGVGVGGLAFGAVYGQQREWHDPVAFVMLAGGALATIALPFYMARARNPLIPLSLFKSRAFTTINISTLLIYGALYVSGYNQALFVQGTLGYTAVAAGLMFIPGGLLLTLMSPRFGTLTGRYVFYAALASRVPGLDPNSPTLRAEVSPLNRPTPTAPANVAAQARSASADAFHTAMLISAGLLVAGAAANAIGVARKQPESEPSVTKEAA